MMYSEFVENTGCKQTQKNYEIFQGIEKIYMATDMTKEEAYKLGKKWIDNSLTESEIESNEKVNAEIRERQNDIESAKFWANWERMTGGNKETIRHYEKEIRNAERDIKFLRGCLYA